MGLFLSKPKTDKTTLSGSGNNISFALSHMQGWRQEMEDAHSAHVALPHPFNDWSFFAVFDGHAGSTAANLCAEKLIEKILEDSNFLKSALEYSESLKNGNGITENTLNCIKNDIIATYIKFDDEMKISFLDAARSEPEKSGTTAVAVLVTPRHYIFINVGDSRCVLYGDSAQIRFTSVDHKPNNLTERQRIESAGGTVSLQRVNGQLAVSRAIGDFDYKSTVGLPTWQQQVSPEPDVSILERKEGDQFLILACDGIFDVITNEDLCIFADYLLKTSNTREDVCNSIINTCFHRGSRDNMSVILLTFPNSSVLDDYVFAQDRDIDRKVEALVNNMIDSAGTRITLDCVFKNLTETPFDHLPPGGGIHSKFALAERAYYERVPEAPETNTDGTLDSGQGRRSFKDFISGFLVNQNMEESDES